MDLAIFHLPAWREGYGVSLPAFYEELLETFRYADQLGWTRGLVTEHHFHYYGGAVPNPAIILTAAARETKRLRLGAAVSLMQLRDPLQVAEDYAMLDQLSGGRCDFGVARGFVPHEFAAFNVVQAEAGERIAEGLEICERFWAGEPFAHHGKHFSFDRIEPWPAAVNRRIPIWNAASNSKDSFINAARRGYPLMMNHYPMSFESLREKFGWYCEAWNETGRSVADRKSMVSFMTHIARTEEQAIAEAQHALAEHVHAFMSVMRGNQWDRSYDRNPDILRNMNDARDIRALFRERTLIGTPEQVAERIARYRDLGFTEIGIMGRYTSLSNHQVMASMQMLSEEVLPMLGERLASS